jgi:hypothetical protein
LSPVDCVTIRLFFLTNLKMGLAGPNELQYTFAAGQFDRQKSGSILECAKSELSEEAGLGGGHWVRLIPEDSDGVSELKWCRNRFVPFLCINPNSDETPQERDPEGESDRRRSLTTDDREEL